MSLEVSKSIWAHSKQSGTSLVMLLALAESANDYGEAHPGVAYLAAKCRMKVRNAQILLRQLETAGEIEIVNQGGEPTATGRTNLYIVKTPDVMRREGVQHIAPLVSQGVQNPVPRGAKSGMQGVQCIAPKPSNTTVLTELSDGEARANENGTPPPPDRDSVRWLEGLGLYPSQVRVDIAKRPVFTPDERVLCETWIEQQNFAKAHVSLHTQYLSKCDLPALAKQRQNGYANGHHANAPPGRPKQPDLHEAFDEDGNFLYLALPDGTEWKH